MTEKQIYSDCLLPTLQVRHVIMQYGQPMNANIILEQIWRSARWIIPAMLILSGLRFAYKARLKGAVGEAALAKVLSPHAQAAMHDVYLPDNRGGLTQIDHLLLSSRGLEVIETKNYSGNILGRATDKTWTQRLRRRTVCFQNPLQQNYGHVQAVKAVVGDTVPVNNVVVFGAAARFKHEQPSDVYSPAQFVRILKQSKSSMQVPPTWLQAWEKLQAECRRDRSTRNQHLAQMRKRHGRDYRQVVGLTLLLGGMLLALWFWMN